MVDCLGLLAIVIMLLYVLLSDTSNKKVEINAVNIRKQEERENKEKKHRKEEHLNEKGSNSEYDQ